MSPRPGPDPQTLAQLPQGRSPEAPPQQPGEPGHLGVYRLLKPMDAGDKRTTATEGLAETSD